MSDEGFEQGGDLLLLTAGQGCFKSLQKFIATWRKVADTPAGTLDLSGEPLAEVANLTRINPNKLNSTGERMAEVANTFSSPVHQPQLQLSQNRHQMNR